MAGRHGPGTAHRAVISCVDFNDGIPMGVNAMMSNARIVRIVALGGIIFSGGHAFAGTFYVDTTVSPGGGWTYLVYR